MRAMLYTSPRANTGTKTALRKVKAVTDYQYREARHQAAEVELETTKTVPDEAQYEAERRICHRIIIFSTSAEPISTLKK